MTWPRSHSQERAQIETDPGQFNFRTQAQQPRLEPHTRTKYRPPPSCQSATPTHLHTYPFRDTMSTYPPSLPTSCRPLFWALPLPSPTDTQTSFYAGLTLPCNHPLLHACRRQDSTCPPPPPQPVPSLPLGHSSSLGCVWRNCRTTRQQFCRALRCAEVRNSSLPSGVVSPGPECCQGLAAYLKICPPLLAMSLVQSLGS